MTSRNYLLAASLLLPVVSPTHALAQTSALKNSETIIVTATRAPQTANKIGSSVTVIDDVAIVRAQSIPVIDLLRDVPGVSFSRNGGVGSLSTVRIRGAEGDQTVLLIDGIKLNDPSSPGGGYDFASLLVGDLARIEILRGPQSTLYGSQALGGVINVITQSGDVPFRAGLTLEAGDLATINARASVRGKVGRLSYAGAVGHFETDGISAAANGVEADDFTNDGAQGRVNFTLNDSLEFEGRIFLSKSDVGIDGFPPPNFVLSDTAERSETEELIIYAGIMLSLFEGRSRTRFGISQTTTDRTSIDPMATPTTTFEANGTNERAEIQSTLDVSPSFQIIAGGEIEEASLQTDDPFNPTLRASTQLGALYLQGQASPTSWLTATLGGRWTTNDRFGDALNTRATVAASFNGGNTIVRAALADGFKAPTLFQLFSDYGNVTLAPEEASSLEVGFEQAFFSRRLVGSITGFQRDTINQIDFISCFGNPLAICTGRPFGTYDNIARSKTNGFEATLEAKPLPRLSILAGYTALDARNKTRGSTNFDRSLARRPKETGFFTASYDFEFGLNLSATLSVVGDSFNNASNSVRLKGYELITLRASQKLSETWSVFARIENAGDEEYQTSAGYNSPPQQTFVGLRASF
jgi:vitamin B12 transporter